MNNPAFLFFCRHWLWRPESVDAGSLSGNERVSPYGAGSGPEYVGFEDQTERANMLLTIAIILIVLWLLGLISSYTLGGWIHLLLIAAIIAFVVQLFMGPRRGPPVA
jgi:Family of unknown function (DUF5670)